MIRNKKLSRKGQISYEYLVIVGMTLTLVVPFFNYSVTNLGINVGVQSGVGQAVEFVNTLEELNTLGPGNIATLSTNQLTNIIIEENTVTATLSNNNVISLEVTGLVQPTILTATDRLTIRNDNGVVKAIPKPEMYGIKPEEGILGETVFTITGEYFTPSAQVFLSSTEGVADTAFLAETQYITDQELQFKLPSETGPGGYTVSVSQDAVAADQLFKIKALG